MTKDDILHMARECGHWTGQTVEMNDVGLERFAALVAAAEREACAKQCDKTYYQHIGDGFGEVRYGIAACAAAIRARSNT